MELSVRGVLQSGKDMLVHAAVESSVVAPLQALLELTLKKKQEDDGQKEEGMGDSGGDQVRPSPSRTCWWGYRPWTSSI